MASVETTATVCERCNAEMPASATAFLVDGRVVCRECHDTLAPICPTCGKDLPERPETTRPCPMCGWAINVVREQDLFDTSLLNKDQFDQLQAMRKKLGVLRRYGITEGQYGRVKAELSQQAGKSVDDLTVMRRLFYLASKACKTDAECATVTHAEAKYLFANGLDYTHVLRRAHKLDLQAMEVDGCSAATIAGPVDTCAYCKKRANATLPIADELRDPELPYADCPNKKIDSSVWMDGEMLHVGVNKNAYCEARYAPKR